MQALRRLKERALVKSLLERNISLVQKSKEWTDHRINFIGGSESAKFQRGDYQTLIDRKTGGGSDISEVPAICWGNLFEPIIERLVAKTYNCTTYNAGSIVELCERPVYSCSPDGFAVVDMRIKRKDGRVVEQPTTVLLEYKCPYSRQVNGSISFEYLAQVQHSLIVCDFVEIGLFCEANFQRCSIAEIADYSDRYRGYFFFYGEAAEACLHDLLTLNNDTERPVDLGICYHQKMLSKSAMCKKKAIIVNPGEEMPPIPAGMFAVLPWYLAKFGTITIKRPESDYLERHRERAYELVDKVKEINAAKEQCVEDY